MQNLSRVYRLDYLGKYFDRERDFIASFYERKASRSGKFI